MNTKKEQLDDQSLGIITGQLLLLLHWLSQRTLSHLPHAQARTIQHPLCHALPSEHCPALVQLPEQQICVHAQSLTQVQ